MNGIYYIGLDIHKKTIAYCIKRMGNSGDGNSGNSREFGNSGREFRGHLIYLL